jgi:fumarylpyruvate hydrolase
LSNRRRFIQGAAAGLSGTYLAKDAVAAAEPRYAVPPMKTPSLPIVGSKERFPVHRIYCMGLNYEEHRAESNMNVPPFYFCKSNDMIVENNSTVRYPMLTKNYHYEIELVVALARGGANIPAEQALDHVFGYAVGLDMTRRDLQMEARGKGTAWEIGKSFEQSAPCAAIHRAADVGHIKNGRIHLMVNDTIKQDADTKEMILDVAHCIAYLSTSVELAPGDLIYTGTPAGVGPVVSGDRMVGKVDKLDKLDIRVA